MILVGCGKSKQSRPAPARELYTGSLFRAARGYAEASGQPWGIVSAKHGLIHPGAVVAPYEHRLSKREQSAWAVWVIDEVMATTAPAVVTILAGREYADPLEDELKRRGVRVKTPLAGLMLGERLGWFKRQREKRR